MVARHGLKNGDRVMLNLTNGLCLMGTVLQTLNGCAVGRKPYHGGGDVIVDWDDRDICYEWSCNLTKVTSNPSDEPR